MNFIKFLKKQTPLLLLTIFLSSCCKREEKLINLAIAKQRVEHYYESGDYNKEMDAIVNRAIKHFKTVLPTNKATVIFDVDETALTNYADEKTISFGYIPKLFHEWVIEADAPAIPQIKRLYDYLVQRGFTIVFLTGRKYNEYDATLKNLKREGFSTFDKLIVRPKHETNITALSYKSNQRKKLVQEGYKIVGSLGDQASDLTGGNTGYTIRVPNYRYLIP